jgi:archaellum component FlaC
MTIKQYAEQKGISPQAVYQRLKKNKVKVESLTEKGTGEITGEGMVILDKLFSSENRQIKPIKDDLIEEQNKQLSTLREEKASLLETVKRLEAEVSSLKEDKDYFKQALEKEQNNLSEIKALLPGKPAASSDRLTWKERLTGRRKT